MSCNWFDELPGRFALGVCTIVAWSCQAATDKAPVPVPQPSVSAPAELAPLDRIDEPNFQLAWTLDTSAAAGSSRGALVLVAKAPFKPNQEYPHKLRLEGKDVRLAKPEITKADMQVSAERVSVPVSFEVIGPNPTLQGTMAFSVCTAEACLIERKDIRLSVAGRSATEGKAVEPAAPVGVSPTVGAQVDSK